MALNLTNPLSVSVLVNAPLQTAWHSFTDPDHITQWNQASPDWHCPAATQDLRPGGKFSSTMAARDGSASFEFEGLWETVEPFSLLEYRMTDGRGVTIRFEETTSGVLVTEDFEAENVYPREFQQQGWQAILESFRQHTESL
ncbi:MAG: SRPBCC domain-containing protein [Bacteroidetes bacterium]|nr:SRPBCC domain-containing protein [Bacteroidota bacterium]